MEPAMKLTKNLVTHFNREKLTCRVGWQEVKRKEEHGNGDRT